MIEKKVHVEILKEHLERGATTNELVEFFGVTKQRIYQLIQRHTLPQPMKQFSRDWPAEKCNAFTEAYQKRLPIGEIRKLFSISYGTVMNVASHLGLKRYADYKTLSDAERYINRLLIEARRRSNVFSDLKVEDLCPLPTHCPILGLELAYRRHLKGYRSNDRASLDQIIPNGGYTKGNTAIISFLANRLKDNGTAAEDLAIADWMYKQEEKLGD